MIPHVERQAVGPYQLARLLDPSAFGERWLAQHDQHHTDWIVHGFWPQMDKSRRVLLLSWMESASRFSHAHLPSIQRVMDAEPGRIWAAEPYLGSDDGLLTVDRLVGLKGGRMSPAETERVLLHTLDAMRFAHELGVCHGALTAGDLLVDRHGSITLDLYGLRRRLAGLLDLDPEVVLDEVRSVAMIGYWVLTGLEAEEPRIRASRLIRRLDRAWDEWFEVALDPASGFSTASDALAALPTAGGRPIVEVKPGPARSVFERLRTAWSGAPDADGA
jgi:serine/threonine protein kinase